MDSAASADTAKSATKATNADKATHASTADSATKATQDSAGQQINTTYIKSLSVMVERLLIRKAMALQVLSLHRTLIPLIQN